MFRCSYARNVLKRFAALVNALTRRPRSARSSTMPKPTPFQPGHALEYAVEVVSRDAKGSATCWCLFCVHEGRVEVEISQNGRKRKRTAQIKMFTAPFYPHKYRSHHESQHAESWALYQDLSKADKKQYFSSQIKPANTLHRHMTVKDDKLVFDISARIVDTIIGDLFFRDDEVLANADSDDDDSDDDLASAIAKKVARKAKEKTNALKLFVKNENDPDWYQVVIPNPMRFELAMDHVSIGMSFRQAAAAIQHARDHTKTATLSGMNDLIVGQYVRVLVGGNLQDISDLMGDLSVWAFSLAFDSSTHFEQSFFDLRIRICFKDGENTMIGRHAGLVTRITRCAEFNVLRVWCAPHQIDIIVKSSAEGINGGAYVKDVYSLSVHLRSQHNLIIQMGVKCPKKTNRWVHLSRILNFYKQYRHLIIAHTLEKHPEKLPSDMWWVITYAVAPAIDEINITFAKLQSRSLLVAQQAEFINALIRTLTAMFCIEVIDPNQSNDDDGEIEYMSIELMRIDVVGIKNHIRDQGSAASKFFDALNAADQNTVIKEIVSYAIMLVTGLTSVKAERDENNQPLDHDTPPIMPQQLITLRPAKFIQEVLDKYRDRLQKFWTSDEFEEIEANHRDLMKMYRDDENMRNVIDKHDINTLFNDAWDCVPRFKRLRAFCGGLATIFPNTTSVESDFSILKWELDAFRTALMHLSLEGIMQAKQRAILKQLWA
ncbi:hypothetical protein BDL97_09G113300 [Sphagnum fallax]|nr:hypothetical protein BDL97_09G113300 [Sphagnum fallax]